MRQYIYEDCDIDARIGDRLFVGSVLPEYGVETIAAFRREGHIVWVPYGSKVEIKGRIYEVIAGELEAQGVMEERFVHSIKCLVDENGKRHSMDILGEQEAVVTYISKEDGPTGCLFSIIGTLESLLGLR